MVFKKLTKFVVRFPWVVIAAWIAAFFALSSAGALKANDVITDDQAEFLPSKYESARGLEFGRWAFGEVKATSSLTLLVKRTDGAKPTRGDGAAVATLAARYSEWRPEWDRID